MTDTVECFKHAGVTVKIRFDDDPMSPLDNRDNLGTLVCWHRQYNLGDKHNFATSEDFQEWLKSHPSIVLPLYLYDYSGLRMTIGAFKCYWNNDPVGYIYVTLADVRQKYNSRVTEEVSDLAVKCLRQEVEADDDYLSGHVYGFVIEDDEGKHLDSGRGFYGLDYCIEEAKFFAEACAGKAHALE